jgi:UDP-N-acetylglucosamine 1-carboxyvinyltransferase
MDALKIQGGVRLRGEVQVSGSKNASLPIMAAALLSSGTSVLQGVPDLADVRAFTQVLEHMGLRAKRAGDALELDASSIGQYEAPRELARTMRASILVLGPLVARFGAAKVFLPGGCAIGARPIDQHLKALGRLGAKIELEHDYVLASAPKGLCGAEVVFDMPTVTGTENLLLAATLARGTTVLRNCARDPEVVDLVTALCAMGADIEGAGTHEITIHGRAELQPYTHRVIADRIECGTFLIAGALAGDPLTVVGGVVEHQMALIGKLRAVGVEVGIDGNRITVARPSTIGAVDVQTAPYPGFPTDMQAQLMTLLALGKGTSVITETIFENRFMHVIGLNRLGANIRVDGSCAVVSGIPQLSGSTVTATDLRAGACLVLAGLVAAGETVVRSIYHLDRGYEHLEVKLRAVGARITRFTEVQALASLKPPKHCSDAVAH